MQHPDIIEARLHRPRPEAATITQFAHFTPSLFLKDSSLLFSTPTITAVLFAVTSALPCVHFIVTRV
jgi:hypothetical protein